MYTAGDGGELENSILDIYKRHRAFNDRIFLYAKAVCCLRLLSVMKVYPICHFAQYASNIMYNMYYEYNIYVSSYMHTSVYWYIDCDYIHVPYVYLCVLSGTMW